MSEDGSVPVHRVLVVDDERDVADTQALFLRLCGQAVQQVYDGATALKLAPEFKPDIVFLDLVMPVMDGVTLMRRLREIGSMAHSRFIAISALSQPSIRDAALSAGFHDYIVKPASAASIIAVLAERGVEAARLNLPLP